MFPAGLAADVTGEPKTTTASLEFSARTSQKSYRD